MYSPNTQLYAAKDSVFFYAIAGDYSSLVEKSKDQFSDPIRNTDESVGITTGRSETISGQEWIEVDWVNTYKKHGLFGIGRGTENEPKRSWVLGIEVTDKSSTQIEAAAAADKAAADAKRKQALIDAVGSNTNAALTANGSGTTSSSNYVWWIVGVVLFLIAALVVWRLAKRTAKTPQQNNTPQAAAPTTLSGIKRPKRLK